MIEYKLNNRSIKRPDTSFHLTRNPTPPPTWLKFLPNGAPYPDIVVEVAVNNESPTKLMNDNDILPDRPPSGYG